MKYSTKKRHKNSKTQHLWKMKGCISGGGCSCSLFKGGNNSCSQCGGKRLLRRSKKHTRKKKQLGGNSVATWNIGYPWTSNVSSWPGVGGIDGQSNYFALNTYPVDPQTSMISERSGTLGPEILTNTPIRESTCQNGGKRGKKRKRQTGKTRKNPKLSKKIKKGGTGFLVQGLVDSGRNLMYNLGSAYNTYNGYPPPTNPKPYLDQLPSSKNLL